MINACSKRVRYKNITDFKPIEQFQFTTLIRVCAIGIDNFLCFFCLDVGHHSELRFGLNLSKCIVCALHAHSDFLKLAGAMLSDSRYLAMVRRATTMPCFANSSVI